MKKEFYFKIEGWMLETFKNDVYSLLIYAYLYSFSANGKACSLNQGAIAERLQITRETVNRRMKKMLALGLIEADENGGFTALKPGMKCDYQSQDGVTISHSKCDYQSQDGVTISHSKCDYQSQQSENASLLNNKDSTVTYTNTFTISSENPETAPEMPIGNRAESAEIEIIKEEKMWFETFWKTYPRKAQKTEVEKEFHKLCKDEHMFHEIMNGLHQLIEEDYQFRDPYYVPKPLAWLNGGCWEDTPVRKKNRASQQAF